MSPQQFWHSNSPVSITGRGGSQNAVGISTPQCVPHLLPLTPKSSQSAPCGAQRRRNTTNRPRSVMLFSSGNSPSATKVPVCHSAPIMGPSSHQLHSSPFVYSTPQHPKRSSKCIYQNQRRTRAESCSTSPVNCFAGAKFSESPKAQQIPLPPTQWLMEASSPGSTSGRNSGNSSLRGSPIPCFALPQSPGASRSTPASVSPCGSQRTEDANLNSPRDGCHSFPVRMNPLQLIAAVAAS